jgi:hypothetical protein
MFLAAIMAPARTRMRKFRDEVVKWAMMQGCEVGQNRARRTARRTVRLSADPADVK